MDLNAESCWWCLVYRPVVGGPSAPCIRVPGRSKCHWCIERSCSRCAPNGRGELILRVFDLVVQLTCDLSLVPGYRGPWGAKRRAAYRRLRELYEVITPDYRYWPDMPLADAEELGLMNPPLPHLRVRDEHGHLLYTTEGDVGGDEDHDDHCDNYSDDDGDQEHHYHNNSSNSIEDDEDFADDGDEDEDEDIAMDSSSIILMPPPPAPSSVAAPPHPPYTAIATPAAVVPSMGRCLQQKYGTGRSEFI